MTRKNRGQKVRTFEKWTPVEDESPNVRLRFRIDDHFPVFEIFKDLAAGDELILDEASMDLRNVLSEFPSNGPSLDQARSTISIWSWNINGMRSAMVGFLRVIREYRPTVICLQEVKSTTYECGIQQGSLFSVLRATGYRYIQWNPNRHDSGDAGTAILSLYPFDNVEVRIDNEKLQSEGRFMAVDIGPVVVINHYAPCTKPGKTERTVLLGVERRAEWDKQFVIACDKVKKLTGKRITVQGNFNVCTQASEYWSEGTDTFDTNASCTVAERNAFAHLKEKLDLIDGFDTLHQDVAGEDKITFRGNFPRTDDGGGGECRMRLDYSLVPPGSIKDRHGKHTGAFYVQNVRHMALG